jgi:hypothetical protein
MCKAPERLLGTKCAKPAAVEKNGREEGPRGLVRTSRRKKTFLSFSVVWGWITPGLDLIIRKQGEDEHYRFDSITRAK